jgi:hypothetical protein
MATQVALLSLRSLQAPVVITDVSQDRVHKGLTYCRKEIDPRTRSLMT